jgi:hypothetical protein
MRQLFSAGLVAAGMVAITAGVARFTTMGAAPVQVSPVSPRRALATPTAQDGPAIKRASQRPAAAGQNVGGTGYSAASPHWPQIRTMVTDFRTGYVANAAQRSAERAWAAAHFDFVLGGDAHVYKSLNPEIRVIPYALDWYLIKPGHEKSTSLASAYYDDMQQWFAAHPQYQLEKAFLHTEGSEPTPETRLEFVSWGSHCWPINPGDPGARAYLADRIRRFTANSDGVFFDTHSSGSFGTALGKMKIAEYPDRQAYQRDMVDYVHGIAAAIAPKIVMINTGEYTRPLDFAMATAAGAVHLERVNNPLTEAMPERWTWVDSLLAHNAIVELVSLDSWAEANNRHGAFATYTPGNYASSAERLKMFELASYYMVVPASPDRLFLDLENAWKVPYDQVWLKAQEYSVGHPTGARHVIQTGRDSTGTGFKIWARDLDHALILARPTGAWKNPNYGDGTAVTVPLPGAQALRPLHGDGTLGSPVTSVTLRNSEAVILIR